MCGRFTRMYSWAELVALYRLTQPPLNLEPNFNTCPTDMVEAVRLREGAPELIRARWGLVPSWWKKPLKELPTTFNARAETIDKKPMFRSAFKRSRCLIPASGYFEWMATSGGKQPYYISAVDGAPLSIAGLWAEWIDPASGDRVTSCTIIITAANDMTRAIHDRMPALLAPADFEPWLAGTAGAELLRPAPDDWLRMWPVSKRVNKPGNADDPSLIDEIALDAA